MRIFICTMEDPVYTNPFIKEILVKRKKDIIGLAVSKGSRFTLGKKRSKILYLFSLFLIMGLYHFIKYSSIIIFFKFKILLAETFCKIHSPSIITFADNLKIPVYRVSTVNNKQFLKELREIKPDLIINQTQNILTKDFLSIPPLGVINRHNSLLPKDRGRLSPFWVLYKKEKETGVSIHFVSEGIDQGDIIIQEKFEITKQDNFNTLVKKNYKIAPSLMIKALDLLASGRYQVIKNDDVEASYNSIPTLGEALRYRLNRMGIYFKKN
ncbi:MAG: methionyl-tRNA formyltransferase [Promethearchaeota archaeon]